MAFGEHQENGGLIPMDVKGFLERAVHLDAMINSEVAELDGLRRLAMKVGSSNLNERITHSAPNEAPFAKWVERIVDKEREINEKIDKSLLAYS